MTPRQACPRPNGFGRNLRSKTRWFTGFCNSHQVSHFATFFIDARAEISVAESRFDSFRDDSVGRCPSESTRSVFRILGTSSAGVWLSPEEERRRGHKLLRPPPPPSSRGVWTHSLVGLVWASTMILPQVHLRKPCYDFSFL